MTTPPLDQHTYFPGADDDYDGARAFIDALSPRATNDPSGASQCLAAVAAGDTGMELPASLRGAFLHVLDALAAGKAVTIAPQHRLLTTQQAADLLGVSRPTVVKLITAGELPAETPGTSHRLIRLDDVLACRERRREAQYVAVMAMAADDAEDAADANVRDEQLRQVRAQAAARRRAQH